MTSICAVDLQGSSKTQTFSGKRDESPMTISKKENETSIMKISWKWIKVDRLEAGFRMLWEELRRSYLEGRVDLESSGGKERQGGWLEAKG